MRVQTSTRLVWIGLGVIVVVVVGSQVYEVTSGDTLDIFSLGMLAFPVVGALIVSRQPANSVGRIMLGIGAGEAFAAAIGLYAAFALDIRPGSLPRPDIALALGEGTWVPFIGLVGTFLLLLFPDGHLPTPGWKPWAWFSGGAMVLAYLIITVAPSHFGDQGYPGLRNPLGIEALRPYIGAAFALIALIPI
ncbi:MAG TPA: hypothetical protein VHV50_02670, partial [Actinomycetota bacterium]|nr:hypothetical protein [Actinomycetota bacterium]